jgi:enoyl-[acyl-carrier protein] reductase II
MFEGDLNEGELEIGQVSAQFIKIQKAEEIVTEMWSEFNEVRRSLGDAHY